MRVRCEVCGVRLDDTGACPRCELDPVLLEDADVGIRREDRYVALPPGPRWVPRRVRRESPIGPFLALAAAIGVLALLVVLAPKESEPARSTPTAPPIAEATAVVLLRAGPAGIEEIDLDADTIRTADPGTAVVPLGTAVDPDTPPPAMGGLELRSQRCGDRRCLAVRAGGATVHEIVEPRAATVSPDGATLALLAVDGSVLVGTADGTVTPVDAGTEPRGITTWSADGRWLFVATHDGRIDAVRDDGSRFRVPVGPRVTDTLGIAP